MNIQQFLTAACLALATLLSACGGGGSSAGVTDTNSTSGTPAGGSGNPAAAAGTWQGSYKGLYGVRLVVLSTGETFGLYETGNTITGGLYGDIASQGVVVSGFLSDFAFNNISIDKENLNGTVEGQKTMVLRRGNQRLDLTYSTGVRQNVMTLAGTYQGRGRNTLGAPDNMTLTISSNGAVNMPASICSSSGQISQHPNGDNVFAINLTITGDNCGRKGTGLSGVAFLDPNNRLYILGLNPTRSDGAFFFGVRRS